MKRQKKVEIEEVIFNQKKINHIVHYTDNFEFLLKILRDGFAPSYCAERINDFDYYVPMISFCNIPLKDVDLYMRYGKFGIGMSLEWALKNSISPVVYIHETTPFKDIHMKLINANANRMTKMISNHNNEGNFTNLLNSIDAQFEEGSQELNNITVPALQFFKNWKTTYRGEEIITYHEREWRYVPNLNSERLILSQEFKILKETKYPKKPHLPEFTLHLDSLDYIRYIMINNDTQRKRVLGVLKRKFGEDIVLDSILSGKLMIISDDLIRNDF